jgi:hypothetical protein
VSPTSIGTRSGPLIGPVGYTPAQIRHAYGFDQIANNGAGQTIAIVDAYDDPTIARDLHAFDGQFGLPDPILTKVNQSGGTSYPASNSNWAIEISLDVEWAHAIASGAQILLVEANSNSYGDLLTAVDYARNQAGVSVVSMSWDSSEFSGETSYDSHFVTPSGHAGVTFVASSGNSGTISYPAASPNVLAVGGTTLYLNHDNTWKSETGWSGSGGGISQFESQPAYQKGVVTQSTTMRTNPDVSYDADPNTGFAVYDSFTYGTSTPWAQIGGTSAGAPQWSALIAIADQGRVQAGLRSLDGPGETLPLIYSLPASDFHDITSGSNGGFSAGPGYDLVTGLGSPVAAQAVAGLTQPFTYQLDSVGNLWKCNSSGQRLQVIDSGVTSFAISPAGTNLVGDVFDLHTNGVLQAYNGSFWASLDSGVTSFAISPAGTNFAGDVFDLHTNGVLQAYNDGFWAYWDSGVSSFAFGLAGTNLGGDLFDLDTNGVLQANTGGGWVTWDSGVTSFALAPDMSTWCGDLFDLHANGVLQTNNGSFWASLDSGVTSFAFAPMSSTWGGDVFDLHTNGVLQANNGSFWASLDSGVTSFAFAPVMSNWGGDVFDLHTNGVLQANNGSGWATWDTGVSWFAFGPAGTSDLDVLQSNGDLRQYVGTTFSVLASNIQSSWIAPGIYGPDTLFARDNNGVVHQFPA